MDLSWVTRSDTLKFFCGPGWWHRIPTSSVSHPFMILWLVTDNADYPASGHFPCSLLLRPWFFSISGARNCLIKPIKDSPSTCQWLFKGGHVTQSSQWTEVCSGVGFWEKFSKVSLLFKRVAQEEMIPSFPVLGCCLCVITSPLALGQPPWDHEGNGQRNHIVSKMRMGSGKRGRI